MYFKTPLIKGTLIKRYKRFLAEIKLESGEIVTAHCPNSGSMLSVCTPQSPVFMSRSDNPNRRLQYTWELIEINGQYVGINTQHPNTLVFEAIGNNELQELKGYQKRHREVKYGQNSRIDILLERENEKCYIEVKNVTLCRKQGLAEFPDSVTARGAKHLDALSEMVKLGHRAVMFFLIQRPDCSHFSIAKDIDPIYSEKIQSAQQCGVEILCYDCEITLQEIKIKQRISNDHTHSSSRRF